MNESTKQTIEKVIRTLDMVAVSGRNNMDMLLGSILTLEKLVKDAATEEKVEETNG
jgi:hypothetical protein